MTYYEELGIRHDASIDEIRQAFKVLARLLHPDGHLDDRLKALAECQMKRLNEVLAILADPQKRREYDESLLGATDGAAVWAPPARMKQGVRLEYDSGLVQFGLRHWFGILIGSLMLGVGLWCEMQGSPELLVAVPDRKPAFQDESEPRGPSSPKRALPAHAPRAVYPREVSAGAVVEATKRDPETIGATFEPKPAGLRREHDVVPSNPNSAPERVPATVEAAGPESASPDSSASESSLAGNWFYSRNATEKADSNLYAATYVEFLLQEEDNNLKGNYRAKYEVPNQAISSEVAFRVQGKSPDGKSAHLSWASDDGARGEVDLTLLSPNQLTVTWWTTAFGPRAALVSGTAVLIRQQRHW
jgi:curved DNA-binding protein CbpA